VPEILRGVRYFVWDIPRTQLGIRGWIRSHCEIFTVKAKEKSRWLDGYESRFWKRIVSDLLWSSLSVFVLAIERFDMHVVGLV